VQVNILGNSNSILANGWVPKIRRLNVHGVTNNYSLGGSPSPALLNQVLMNIDKIEGNSITIIEPTVIDHCSTWQSPEEVLFFAKETIKLLHSKKSKVIVIALPRFLDNIINPSKGQLSWKSACEIIGAEYICGSELILNIFKKDKLIFEKIWIDNSGHFSETIQEGIAKEVFDLMAILENEEVGGDNQPLHFFNYFLDNEVQFEKVHYKNSIIDESFFKINSPIKLCCLSEKTYLYGMKLNYASFESGTSLVFECNGKRKEILLDNEFVKDKAKLLVLFKRLSIEVFEGSQIYFENNALKEKVNVECSSILLGPQVQR
jgi:hypothetical protein